MPSSQTNRRTFLKQGLLGACAVGGLGAAYASYPKLKQRFFGQNQPNIILITLDTTRADHLGCYGYERPTSPNIDQLAAESLVYERAIASATWTLPSHASLFTGKFTASHGACKVVDGPLDLTIPLYGPKAINHYRARSIAENETTLAMLLSDAGYQTMGVVAGPWLKHVFGLNKGFEFYDDDNIETVNARLGEEVTDRALQMLRTPSAQPRFLFLNYFDPHSPYCAPPEFSHEFVTDYDLPADVRDDPAAIQKMIGLYDGEIRYMDYHLGRLFEGLKQYGMYDDAWIFITADHGELMGENGAFGHGGEVYQGVVHVPMIVKAPRGQQAPGRDDRWIQLVDVFPQILDVAGVAIPEGIQGQLPEEIDHPIVIESRTLPDINTGGDWFSIIDEGWKYVWSSEGNHKFFNLNEDPGEENNLFTQLHDQARLMDDSMHEYLASLPLPGPQAPATIDKKMQATLKSLGYIR